MYLLRPTGPLLFSGDPDIVLDIARERPAALETVQWAVSDEPTWFVPLLQIALVSGLKTKDGIALGGLSAVPATRLCRCISTREESDRAWVASRSARESAAAAAEQMWGVNPEEYLAAGEATAQRARESATLSIEHLTADFTARFSADSRDAELVSHWQSLNGRLP